MRGISVALMFMIGAFGCSKSLKEGKLTTTTNTTGKSLRLEAYVPVDPAKENPSGFTLSLFADTTHPESALLRLVSVGNSLLKAECNQLQLLAGEQEVVMGLVVHDKTLVISGSTANNQDTFLAVLSAESLQRLSSASAMKGKACGASFSLNEAQLGKVKEFAAQLSPSPATQAN